jgi:hypothetical protein
MRKFGAALVAGAVLGIGTGYTQPSAASTSPVAVVKTCSAGYLLARLSWGVKCLRAGEFCKVGNREYLRYGFVCPSTGHLRRR